ncbi:hypothetical protein CI957_1839 [Methanohalophilus sp. WG1-DM]|nr:hypothetical protein CI957_1839 [Methanohalophilus sp. WG1-DM]
MYAALPQRKKGTGFASFPRKFGQPILQGNLRYKSQCSCSTDTSHAVADVAGAGLPVFQGQVTAKNLLHDPGEPVDGGLCTGTGIEDPAEGCVLFDQQFYQIHDVMHRDEIAGLLPVAEDYRGLAGFGTLDEFGDDAGVGIGGVLAGAVDVEGTQHCHGQVEGAVVHEGVLFACEFADAVGGEGLCGMVLIDRGVQGVAVDGGGAEVDEAFQVCLAGCLEEVEGAENVVFAVKQRLVQGAVDIDLGGGVDDYVGLLDQPYHFRALDVADDQLDSCGHFMSAGRGCVVQHDYPVVGAEAVGQIRADLTQPAGDEDCLGVHGLWEVFLRYKFGVHMHFNMIDNCNI